MEIWLAVGVLGAAAIPWATAITSNGMRVVLIFVYTFLVARVAMGVHGAAMAPPERSSSPSSPRPTSWVWNPR